MQTAGKTVWTIVAREKLVNGQVVSSEEISSTVTKEPVSEVVLVGTREVVAAQALLLGAASTSGGVIRWTTAATRFTYRRVYRFPPPPIPRRPAFLRLTGRPAQYGNVAVKPNPDLWLLGFIPALLAGSRLATPSRRIPAGP